MAPGEHSPGVHPAGGDRHPHLLLLHSLWHAGAVASWISFFKVVHKPTSNTSKTMLSCSNGFSTFSVSSTNTVHQGAIRNFQTGKILNSEVIRTPGTCNAETYQSNSWTPKKHYILSLPRSCAINYFLISRSLKMFWLLSTYTKLLELGCICYSFIVRLPGVQSMLSTWSGNDVLSKQFTSCGYEWIQPSKVEQGAARWYELNMITGKSQGTLSQPTTCSSPCLPSWSSSSTSVGSTSPRPWSTPLARTMRTLTSTTSSTGSLTPHNQINHEIDSSIEITLEPELYLCAKQRTCTFPHLIFPSKLHGSQNLSSGTSRSATWWLRAAMMRRSSKTLTKEDFPPVQLQNVRTCTLNFRKTKYFWEH